MPNDNVANFQCILRKRRKGITSIFRFFSLLLASQSHGFLSSRFFISSFPSIFLMRELTNCRISFTDLNFEFRLIRFGQVWYIFSLKAIFKTKRKVKEAQNTNFDIFYAAFKRKFPLFYFHCHTYLFMSLFTFCCFSC